MKSKLENYIGKEVNIKIDRPLGSKHPKYDFIYTLNYGYIPDTISGDGEEIDVYIIGEFGPLETYKGHVVAIIKRMNDVEDKLVVCKEKDKYCLDAIKALVEFQERFFEYIMIS